MIFKKTNFTTEQDAARAILGEAALTFTEVGIDYVILGGWIPYLFNNTKILPHPGSFDVDVLLNPETTKQQFNDSVLDKFKKVGYMLPPKNKFQLYKVLNVNNEKMIFHIDLLHVNYAPYQDDLLINWGKMQSINGPGTDIIFSGPERFSQKLKIRLPSGSTKTVNINFSNEIGFLSAKGRALSSPKRKRDSYDIYMIITQSSDYEYLINKAHTLYHTSKIFSKSIDAIKKFFLEGEKQGLKNTKQFMLLFPNEIMIPNDSMESVVENRMRTFLDRVMQK